MRQKKRVRDIYGRFMKRTKCCCECAWEDGLTCGFKSEIEVDEVLNSVSPYQECDCWSFISKEPGECIKDKRIAGHVGSFVPT